MWPFSLFRRSRTVWVELIHAETGAGIAQAQVPVDRLPTSFERDTTLHLDDENWQVVEATPATAEAYVRAGRLQLRVVPDRVQLMDPNEVLFSLPTISGALPALESRTAEAAGRVLMMHEDDWRQLEWIPSTAQERAEQELAAIRAIYEHERVGNAFRRTHARDALTMPFAGVSVELDALRDAIGKDATWFDSIAIYGYGGVVRGGFAVQLVSSIRLYGTASDDGFLNCVALAPDVTPHAAQADDAQRLASFASRHDLLLVDWVRARIVSMENATYRALGYTEG